MSRQSSSSSSRILEDIETPLNSIQFTSILGRLRRCFEIDRTMFREVFLLSWPITLTMLGDAAMGLVDTRLVAGLGSAALGGVGLAITLMYLFYSIVFGLMRGVKVRVAHAIGEGPIQDAQSYAWGGVFVGLLMGLFIWAIARDSTYILKLLRVEAPMIPYARDFLAARTWGAPAICMGTALMQYRQGLGDTRIPMMIGLCGNIANALLANALIYGRWSAPALGVAGAGYATATVEALQTSVLLILLIRAHTSLQGSSISIGAALKDVVQIGGPTGLQFGLEMLAMTAFTAIVSGIGTAEIAAHQIAMSILRASFLPGIAIGEAASIIVGRFLGARKLSDADRALFTAVRMAIAVMTFCGLVFAISGRVLAQLFSHDATVIRITTHLLLMAALFQALDAITIVLRGALRGAKDVRVVALLGISIAWICIPGSAYLLGRILGWGALGGWCGFLAETTFASILFWRRWTRGLWRKRYNVNTVITA